jgi:hypothetical protein
MYSACETAQSGLLGEVLGVALSQAIKPRTMRNFIPQQSSGEAGRQSACCVLCGLTTEEREGVRRVREKCALEGEDRKRDTERNGRQGQLKIVYVYGMHGLYTCDLWAL